MSEPEDQDLYLIEMREKVEEHIRDLEGELLKIDQIIELRARNRELREQIAVMNAENDQIRAYLSERNVKK